MHEIHKAKWDEKEIQRAAKIILHAEKNKSAFVRILDEIVHWIVLLMIFFGNCAFSIAIVFLSALSVVPFYSLVIISAVTFGALIETPIRDIEKLDKNKHFLSRVILPLLVLVNVYVLFGAKAAIENITKIKFEFNPVLVGIIYGTFFLMPHTISYFFKKRG
jgi:hypothetical protein